MDQSPSETKRPKQARARRTRERILDRAEEVFAAKGFDGSSLTSDILEPTGVSVGSFYHQFSDKRAVLMTLLAERRGSWIERLTEQFEPDRDASPVDVARACILALLDDVERRPNSWWLHIRELQHPDPEIRRAFETEWAGAIHRIARAVGGHDRSQQPPCQPGCFVVISGAVGGLVRAYLTADAPGREHIRTVGVDTAAGVLVTAIDHATDRH